MGLGTTDCAAENAVSCICNWSSFGFNPQLCAYRNSFTKISTFGPYRSPNVPFSFQVKLLKGLPALPGFGVPGREVNTQPNFSRSLTRLRVFHKGGIVGSTLAKEGEWD